MPHGDKGAVEVFEKRHDDSPAAPEPLPQIAHRRRTMLRDEGFDVRRRLRDRRRAQDEFGTDLDDFPTLDEELERTLRGHIRCELLARRWLQRLRRQRTSQRLA